MVIKEIDDFDSFEFEQSIDIYKSSFPSNETRPVQRVVVMLKNDKNYHLFISVNNNSVVGIALMYIFKPLRIGLLDYISVIPNYRRRGIGEELFKFTLEKFGSLVSNGIGLLIEIQRENVLDPEESVVRKNRISFYTLLGAKVLKGVNYLLPPMRNGGEAEEMYLMIRPLGEVHLFQKHLLLDTYVRYILRFISITPTIFLTEYHRSCLQK
ncbi:MAG: GNAT family N-acetyltransferase [Candidatus Nitrosopolaris sp.]